MSKCREDLLGRRTTVLCDGAMGTCLEGRGIFINRDLRLLEIFPQCVAGFRIPAIAGIRPLTKLRKAEFMKNAVLPAAKKTARAGDSRREAEPEAAVGNV
jgi:hypothetical protein